MLEHVLFGEVGPVHHFFGEPYGPVLVQEDDVRRSLDQVAHEFVDLHLGVGVGAAFYEDRRSRYRDRRSCRRFRAA